eukprot:TRINITY_DN2371_c0_g1_i1.p2 TRINITY_DN2371_c0_g1~~TRINITY_DN2371_c0_g1_i1.p2  ORF type:complete len:398 (-),score=103.30 TRINITY_DN2371_c0_g1_i1:1275-2468(-)
MEWLEEQQQQKGTTTTTSSSSLVGEEGGVSEVKKRMLGAEATVHIQKELSSKQPNKVISEFQKYHSLDPLFKKRRISASNPAAAAEESGGVGGASSSSAEEVELWGLLGMLELMGLTKADVNLSLLSCLRNSLLFQIENNLSAHKLYELLESTFKWINFGELRPLVLAIMKKLPSLSITYLKQLSTSPPPPFFSELPIEVKRQIWLLDDSFLTSHFLPLIRQYLTFYSATSIASSAVTSSTSSLLTSSTYSSSSSLLSPVHHSHNQQSSPSTEVSSSTASPPASPPHSPTVAATSTATMAVLSSSHAPFTFPPMISLDPLHMPTPQKRREKNVALQEIVKAIGGEVEIYQKFLKLIKSSVFNDLDNQNRQRYNHRICTLRTDVLMALHDAGISEVYI